MKRILLGIAMLVFFSNFCSAQAGNNAIGIGAEATFLASNGYSSLYNPGFGGDIKGMYGINPGQLTLTVGYNSFSSKSGSIAAGQTLSLLPIQAGYHYTFSQGFYLEPQLGMGILKTKFDGGSFSQTNFAGALNVGYTVNGFDFSVRYYTEGDVISAFAIRVGYNFSLSGSK